MLDPVKQKNSGGDPHSIPHVISEAVDRVIIIEATCVSGWSFDKEGEKRFQF